MSALTAPPETGPAATPPAARLTPGLVISISVSLLMFYIIIWSTAGIAWWSFSGLFGSWLPLRIAFAALFGLPAAWATWQSTHMVVAGEFAIAAGEV